MEVPTHRSLSFLLPPNGSSGLVPQQQPKLRERGRAFISGTRRKRADPRAALDIPPGSKEGITAAHPLTTKYPNPRAIPLSNLSTRHFVNLTNGIEALSALATLLPPSVIRFTRIQSSHCESGAFDKLLGSLDTELLFSLACGRDCYVYDFASRNKTSGVPRALFLGLEFVKWSVAYLWWGEGAERVLVRGKNLVPFWRDVVLAYKVGKDAKKHVRYFEPFARELGVREVKLHGVYGRISEIDGCKELHVRLVREWLEGSEGDRSGKEDALNHTKVEEWIRMKRYAKSKPESTEKELVNIQEWMARGGEVP